MNNLIILPIILPVIAGMIMVVFRNQIRLHRALSLFTLTLVGIVAVMLIGQIQQNGIQALQVGGWQAPFGVSMVADMFSVLLVFTTSVVAFCCIWYAFYSIGEAREKHYFYPFALFLIAGVNGSFLSGDIFNLFVCFEVMLVASYVMITLGGAKTQLRESLTYVLINMISSFLFLVAIAFLYHMTGTLNMAHLSVRVAEVGQGGLMTAVAFLFLTVFSLKAGLFLFYWIPGSYGAPPPAIAAMFAALLTKVGIYAIIRIFSLVFYHEPETTHYLIGILAALTMTFGAMGAVAFNDIKRIMTYNVVISVGLILAGFASFCEAGLSGAVYYLIHDMLIKGLLFLIGGTIFLLTGTDKIREMSGLIRSYPRLGWMFLLAAFSVAGIPPLSGFIGKILITEGTFRAGYYWLGGLGLLASLMVLYSMLKIFMNVFWGYPNEPDSAPSISARGLLMPMAVLTAITIVLGLGAQGIYEVVNLAVQGLLDPGLYIGAVLEGRFP